ncbi:hypothetical protein PMAYCL1PPCAC_19669, partial [Pristionchus mayeri]
VSLSEDDQRSLQTRQHVLFVVSTILSIDALLFLINQTPPIQAKIRTYLLMIQICVLAIDVHDSLLLEPIFVAEECIIYCRGLLSHIRVCLTPNILISM